MDIELYEVVNLLSVKIVETSYPLVNRSLSGFFGMFTKLMSLAASLAALTVYINAECVTAKILYSSNQ